MLDEKRGNNYILPNNFNKKVIFSISSFIFLLIFYNNLYIYSINKKIGILINILILILYLLFKQKIFTSKMYLYIISFYFVESIYSLKNEFFLRDIKYHILFFVILFLFDQIYRANNKYINFKKILLLSFNVSAVVWITYLLLKINFIPRGIFLRRELPEYQSFRIMGPSLGVFLLVPFCFAAIKFENVKKRVSKYLIMNFFIGLFSISLSGSLQNLVIFLLIYFIAIFKKCFIKTFFRIFIIMLIFYIVYMNLGEKHKEKILLLKNPLSAPTVLTRINDLIWSYEEIVRKSDIFQKLFGSGIGVRTEVKRVSWDGRRVEFREFLEIDNGFFYILHRIGYIGLIAYLFLFILILFHYGNTKTKFMFASFFIITNLLSIHFFTNPFSPILTYLFIRSR